MSIFAFKNYASIDIPMVRDVLREFDEKLQMPYEGNLETLLGRHVTNIKFLSQGTYGAVFDCQIGEGNDEHHYVLKVNFFNKERNCRRIDESSNCESILQQIIFNIFSIHDKPHAIKMQYTFLTDTDELQAFLWDHAKETRSDFKRFNIKRQSVARRMVEDILLLAHDMNFDTFLDTQFDDIIHNTKKMRAFYYLLCFYYKYSMGNDIAIKDIAEDEDFITCFNADEKEHIYEIFDYAYSHIRKIILDQKTKGALNTYKDIMKNSMVMSVQSVLCSLYSRKNAVCRMTLAQRAECDLLHYIRQNHQSICVGEWKSIFFQTMYILHVIQTFFPQFRHNDFKANNLLIVKAPGAKPSEGVNPNKTDHKYYRVKSRGPNGHPQRQLFKIPHYGYNIIIWDFDFACIDGMVHNAKLDADWVKRFNMSREENKYYDLFMFFSFLDDVVNFKNVTMQPEVKEFVKATINPIPQVVKVQGTDSEGEGIDILTDEQIKLLDKNKILYHASNRVLNKKEFTTPHKVIMMPFFEEFQRQAPINP